MREFDSNIDIDYSATRRFFDQRGAKMTTVGPLSAVLYQDHDPELARQRSSFEFSRIAPSLASGVDHARILDLGCGTGRWMEALKERTASYIGLDFCPDFLVEGRRTAATLPRAERFDFEHADLSQGLPAGIASRRYDVIIVSGVLIYLNDVDVRVLIEQIAMCMAPAAVLYIREPLGTERRLTLKDHFSSDLEANYSSVYRSLQEFKDLLSELCPAGGLRLQETGSLYPAELEKRAETRQYYFLLHKQTT